jgi:hypothetical protein
MKCNYLLLLVLCVALSGCGVDWFPASTSSGSGSDGSALTAPTVRAALSPTTIASGGSSTLTLTILNKTGNPAQSGLSFVETLPAGVTATIANSTCGGEASVPSSSAGGKIVLTGGLIASGTASCSVTANLTATNTGTTEQSFVIESAKLTNLQGGLVSGVTDLTLTVTPVLTLNAAIIPMLDGGNSTLTITINNEFGRPVQNGLAFVETLPTDLKATVTNAAQCGGTLTASGTSLTFSGGKLASGDASCTLTAELSQVASGTLTAEKSFDIKNFSNLQGGLTNGVTALSLKVFPSAITDSTGVVTVSNLTRSGFTPDGNTAVDVSFNADTRNDTTSSINTTVTVVGIDNSGADIVATETALSVSVLPGSLNKQVTLNVTPVTVSGANYANIALWRILSVSLN